MRFGPFEVHPVIYGRFALDGGAMFGVVPKALWSRSFPADDKNRIPLALRGLLLVDKRRKILVDTGMGDKWAPKHKEIYRLDLAEGGLEGALGRVGVAREEITDVIITHLHFDHGGGNTVVDQERLVPTFPRATYHVSSQNLAWARHPTPRDRGSYLPDNFEPLKSQLREVEGKNIDLGPDLSIIISQGHTPGQMVPLLHQGKQKLIFCGDLIPTSAHIPLPWVMGYDLFPVSTMEEKKALLQEAAREGHILVFEHDPVVAAVRVREGRVGVEVDREVALEA